MKLTTLAFSLVSVASVMAEMSDMHGDMEHGDMHDDVYDSMSDCISETHGHPVPMTSSHMESMATLYPGSSVTHAMSSMSAAPDHPPQDDKVALVVKAAANAEVKGSLEVVTGADGSLRLVVKKGGEPAHFDQKDGTVSLEAAANADAAASIHQEGGAAANGAASAHAQASSSFVLHFDKDGKVVGLTAYASASGDVKISTDGSVPADAEPIEIYKQPVHYEAHAAASAGAYVSFGYNKWSNGTMTKSVYTTTSTGTVTVTETSCATVPCEPKTVTYTTQTVITYTVDCLSMETGSYMPSSMATSTISPTNTRSPVAPSISSFNGATKKAVGAAGFAGLLALML